MFNIVLVNPEIPQNTGNIGRLVLAENATLHIVKPMGFRLEDKYLKRAGLDYWEKLNPVIWNSFEEFVSTISFDNTHLFSTRGALRYDQAEYKKSDFLIFGAESSGLPVDFLREHELRTRHIPMPNLSVRSINLSTSVAAVLFEALRQNNFFV